jgi:tetratricopeptide (TPR) repeat protein
MSVFQHGKAAVKPSKVEEREFAVGTPLGGRFRIVRVVGRGGMGTVYEAFDEKMNRRVALKCARPGYRFHLLPEAQAARDISHFNICKVHELHVLSSPLGEVDCISMEFVEGVTLGHRIDSEGPLSSRDTREVALQICAGLAQVHRAGVIHGDLKCGNIIVARSGEGRMRAVVTDFGLARMRDAAGDPQQGRAGTVDYMAPELLLGAPASVASDIYALGILFHVMLTGRVPPLSGVPPARNPPEPGSLGSQSSTVTSGNAIRDRDWQREIDAIPRSWKRVIKRCLAPHADRRFRAVEAVAGALAPRHRASKWAAAVVGAVVLVGGGRQWRSPVPVNPVRLAVLPISVEGDPFENAPGIGLEVADKLTGVRRKFMVIPPREAERNQSITPARARSALGATHTLETHVHASGATVSAEARLFDLQSGRTLGRLSGTYPTHDTVALAKALVATVTGALQLPATSKESVSAAANAPFVQAMDLLRQDNLANAAKAIPLLNQAIALDSASALPYAALAQAQVQMFVRGEGAKWLNLADATVAKARAINADSVPVLLASGIVQQQHGNYEQAIREFTRATAISSEESEGWRHLAACYDLANRTDEAVATYRRAIETQPDYYRHYLGFGSFYFKRGQFDRAEEQYRRVISIAPGLASGHMNLGLALMEKGHFPDAEKELLQALSLGESRNLLMNLGGFYYAQEKFQEAAMYFERALAMGTASAVLYRDLGDAYRWLGKTRKASAAYRQGVTVAREDITRNPRRADSRALLALMFAFLGDRPSAQFEIEQALTMEPESRSVIRDAVTAYEVFGQREKAIAVLSSAPGQVLEELSRQPDTHDLQRDPRFQALLGRKAAE